MIQGRCRFRFPTRLTITKQISRLIHIRDMPDAAPVIHEAILEKGILKIKLDDVPREGICCA
jgi:hypothetical protein